VKGLPGPGGGDGRTAYLIRHAQAGDRGRWTGPDRLRPLTEKGHRQANGIVELLGEEPMNRIVSSSFVRCVESVEPLAAAVGLTIELSDELAEGAGPEAALQLMDGLEGRGIVVCTHGDVILDVLATLSRRSLDLPRDLPSAKGSIWVFELGPSGISAARYLPPPG
jgi:8-oxo-dGTP diphosphatase